MMILYTDPKVIGSFLSLCDSNWHNCCFVHCNTCRYPKRCDHADFLFVTDQAGKPLLLPLSDAVILFAERPEAEECILSMTLHQFLVVYHFWLTSLPQESESCLIDTLLKLQADAMYDW